MANAINSLSATPSCPTFLIRIHLLFLQIFIVESAFRFCVLFTIINLICSDEFLNFCAGDGIRL
ncbi:hypothetical protein CDL12_19661 [Handroanthus impetiginosus]|uniref:Uncharacterized protein n=1 Tax=Handroanthus impetiginosus TaxID=429701 RepID=A0A2G9GR41_9LAMI|nr:hypothetical protein CDL12_19661 [Handroanthus impetiginosus]